MVGTVSLIVTFCAAWASYVITCYQRMIMNTFIHQQRVEKKNNKYTHTMLHTTHGSEAIDQLSPK